MNRYIEKHIIPPAVLVEDSGEHHLVEEFITEVSILNHVKQSTIDGFWIDVMFMTALITRNKSLSTNEAHYTKLRYQFLQSKSKTLPNVIKTPANATPILQKIAELVEAKRIGKVTGTKLVTQYVKWGKKFSAVDSDTLFDLVSTKLKLAKLPPSAPLRPHITDFLKTGKMSGVKLKKLYRTCKQLGKTKTLHTARFAKKFVTGADDTEVTVLTAPTPELKAKAKKILKTKVVVNVPKAVKFDKATEAVANKPLTAVKKKQIIKRLNELTKPKVSLALTEVLDIMFIARALGCSSIKDLSQYTTVKNLKEFGKQYDSVCRALTFGNLSSDILKHTQAASTLGIKVHKIDSNYLELVGYELAGEVRGQASVVLSLCMLMTNYTTKNILQAPSLFTMLRQSPPDDYHLAECVRALTPFFYGVGAAVAAMLKEPIRSGILPTYDTDRSRTPRLVQTAGIERVSHFTKPELEKLLFNDKVRQFTNDSSGYAMLFGTMLNMYSTHTDIEQNYGINLSELLRRDEVMLFSKIWFLNGYTPDNIIYKLLSRGTIEGARNMFRVPHGNIKLNADELISSKAIKDAFGENELNPKTILKNALSIVKIIKDADIEFSSLSMFKGMKPTPPSIACTQLAISHEMGESGTDITYNINQMNIAALPTPDGGAFFKIGEYLTGDLKLKYEANIQDRVRLLMRVPQLSQSHFMHTNTLAGMLGYNSASDKIDYGLLDDKHKKLLSAVVAKSLKDTLITYMFSKEQSRYDITQFSKACVEYIGKANAAEIESEIVERIKTLSKIGPGILAGLLLVSFKCKIGVGMLKIHTAFKTHCTKLNISTRAMEIGTNEFLDMIAPDTQRIALAYISDLFKVKGVIDGISNKVLLVSWKTYMKKSSGLTPDAEFHDSVASLSDIEFNRVVEELVKFGQPVNIVRPLTQEGKKRVVYALGVIEVESFKGRFSVTDAKTVLKNCVDTLKKIDFSLKTVMDITARLLNYIIKAGGFSSGDTEKITKRALDCFGNVVDEREVVGAEDNSVLGLKYLTAEEFTGALAFNGIVLDNIATKTVKTSGKIDFTKSALATLDETKKTIAPVVVKTRLISTNELSKISKGWLSNRTGRHGDVALQCDEAFDVDMDQIPGFNSRKYEQLKKDEPGTERTMMLHGCPPSAAACILRYGFLVKKQVDSDGINTVGRALGDGVYLAEASDKAAGYISNAGFKTGQRGSGFLLECKWIPGKKDVDYREMGLGTSINTMGFRSAEWVCFNYADRLKIVRAYKVRGTSKSKVEASDGKYLTASQKQVINSAKKKGIDTELWGSSWFSVEQMRTLVTLTTKKVDITALAFAKYLPDTLSRFLTKTPTTLKMLKYLKKEKIFTTDKSLNAILDWLEAGLSFDMWIRTGKHFLGKANGMNRAKKMLQKNAQVFDASIFDEPLTTIQRLAFGEVVLQGDSIADLTVNTTRNQINTILNIPLEFDDGIRTRMVDATAEFDTLKQMQKVMSNPDYTQAVLAEIFLHSSLTAESIKTINAALKSKKFTTVQLQSFKLGKQYQKEMLEVLWKTGIPENLAAVRNGWTSVIKIHELFVLFKENKLELDLFKKMSGYQLAKMHVDLSTEVGYIKNATFRKTVAGIIKIISALPHQRINAINIRYVNQLFEGRTVAQVIKILSNGVDIEITSSLYGKYDGTKHYVTFPGMTAKLKKKLTGGAYTASEVTRIVHGIVSYKVDTSDWPISSSMSADRLTDILDAFKTLKLKSASDIPVQLLQKPKENGVYIYEYMRTYKLLGTIPTWCFSSVGRHAMLMLRELTDIRYHTTAFYKVLLHSRFAYDTNAIVYRYIASYAEIIDAIPMTKLKAALTTPPTTTGIVDALKKLLQ